MPTDDLISVIFPAYNHERYIEECIRSIMAQTYRNIELIVIDDGSKDGTFAKMQELKPECEKRFARVVFETQDNLGVCACLNRMFDRAKGKYVCLTASDDVLKPSCVEKLHDFLSVNPDYVLAVGDNEIIDDNSKRIFWGRKRDVLPEKQAVYKTVGEEFRLNEPDNLHPDFGDYGDLLKDNYVPNGFLCLRQAVIDVGKYNPDIMSDDWYMHLQLAKKGKFKYIPEILFSYRWHGGNTINSPEYVDGIRGIYRRIYEHEKEYCFMHGYKKQWKYLWSKKVGWRLKWKRLRDFIRGGK